MVGDIEDCARYLRERWTHDGQPLRIGVYGGSYGEYAVLMAMTRFAGAYDCGALVIGISNLLTFLENTAPYRGRCVSPSTAIPRRTGRCSSPSRR